MVGSDLFLAPSRSYYLICTSDLVYGSKAQIRGFWGYELVGEPGLISRLWLRTPLLVPSRLAFLQRSASGTVLRYARSYCIRSSIRRCLSMLHKTSDGNELALPATNA